MTYSRRAISSASSGVVIGAPPFLADSRFTVVSRTAAIRPVMRAMRLSGKYKMIAEKTILSAIQITP